MAIPETRCAAHPDVRTSLRCGRCEKPICPRCMVETPVGMKCRDCAGLRKLPVFRVSTAHYLRAGGAGFVLAVAFGLAWTILRIYMPFSGFFGFFIAAGVGYGLGELMSRSANRKRGTGLAVLGGVMAVICYALLILVFPPFFGVRFVITIWDLLIVAVLVVITVNHLR